MKALSNLVSTWAIWIGAGTLLLILGLAVYRIRTGDAHAGESSTLQGGTWVSFGGLWSTDGTRVDNASEERGDKEILSSETRKDIQIEADIHMTAADGEAGLLLRSSGEENGVDAYHGYFAGVRAADGLLEFGRADFGWQPLRRISLPKTMGLDRGFHLHMIAVGCQFGVEVRSVTGMRRSLQVSDEACLASGHPGLRSTLTSATWNHLSIRSAVAADLIPLQISGIATRNVPLDEPYDYSQDAAYEAALRDEASKRTLRAGVQPIAGFLMRPGRHANATLQGVVISLPPLVAIQDETNALIIPTFTSNVPLKLGDFVTAHGTVVSERFRSRLDDADIRVLWSDPPTPPLAVTAAQLTGGTYRGRSISLEGILIDAANQVDGQVLILRDGDLLFRGVAAPGYKIDVSRLETGSRLRIRGLATSLNEFTNGTYPFAVLVDKVELVSSPPWWSPRHILMLIFTCVLLTLAAQVALHRAQQWRMESVLKEREQLAFEMHDTLAQSFTGIAFQLRAASIERRGETMMRQHIVNAIEMVNLSHREASRTIAALRPQLRSATAIVEALGQVATRLSDGGHLRVETTVVGRSTAFPVRLTDALFRIGQEAISNAVQHSGCSYLKVELAILQGKVSLSIQDNGAGFEIDKLHGGLGISGMRSRAEKVRAKLDIRSYPVQQAQRMDQSHGTVIEVTATLPRTARMLGLVGGWLAPSRTKHPLQLQQLKEGRHANEHNG